MFIQNKMIHKMKPFDELLQDNTSWLNKINWEHEADLYIECLGLVRENKDGGIIPDSNQRDLITESLWYRDQVYMDTFHSCPEGWHENRKHKEAYEESERQATLYRYYMRLNYFRNSKYV